MRRSRSHRHPLPKRSAARRRLDAREAPRARQGSIGLSGGCVVARVTIAHLVHILMLSAGDAGPGQRVHVLAAALARAGNYVDLVMSEQPGQDVGSEELEHLRVVHVAEYPPFVPTSDRLAWALQLSAGMLERSTQLSASHRYDG